MNKIKRSNLLLLFSTLLLAPAISQAQDNNNNTSGTQSTAWKMQPITIQSRWAKNVTAESGHKEYPRPQLERGNWTNLNGLWKYAITAKDATQPTTFNSEILVPYPIESALSGVKKSLKKDENLWYKRSFSANPKTGEKTILNFGAVDYEATVYVNGKLVGNHKGGYTAFSFDITSAIKQGENELIVKVYDPTEFGNQPHGKQVTNPQNIYYTPSSGIWQTVWLETVPANYISGLTITPDIDKSIATVTVYAPANSPVSLTIDGKTIKGKANTPVKLPINNPKLWSPLHPYLYDLTVTLGNDKVKSYLGMRKISVAKDAKGEERIMLNNKPYFNLGTLDQGFWPDGLYTAPNDEALAYDIKAIKAMGFNTIRKHIKIEPARWYYHADKIGMLVWQDMVNPNQGLPDGAKEAYETQVKETMDLLHNYPSITTWVVFNEQWGSYDQERMTKAVKDADPSRIVNGHSGDNIYIEGKHQKVALKDWENSDIIDYHSYPDPMTTHKLPGKARVVGEFGGIGVFIPDHQWNPGNQWGYITEKPAGLEAKYTIMNQHLKLLENDGLSASIYTQPFDVESEQNGLMTYDREVIKIPFAQLRKIHTAINPDISSPSWMDGLAGITATDADLTEPAKVYSAVLQQYIDGKREPAFLKKMAMLAAQAGDKPGASLAGSDYIATLKAPYSTEDMAFMENQTKKVTDKGFAILAEKAKTDRPTYVKVMNIIYGDVLAGLIGRADNKPNWDQIAEKAKAYGAPGEEMLLRAKTVHTLNQQDWELYKPTAKAYLEKYGANIRADEKEMFQKNISDH